MSLKKHGDDYTKEQKDHHGNQKNTNSDAYKKSEENKQNQQKKNK